MRKAIFFQRTYDETLELLVEASNYVRLDERRERMRVGTNIGSRIVREGLRVTFRLTQVMAWLMIQRAVYEGELTAKQALEEKWRLSGCEVCLDDAGAHDHEIPAALRGLLVRSYHLYLRALRLEAMSAAAEATVAHASR
ncbi:conserved hypothetical protein [Candidatus Terasakiella magnetica]|jgi:regulator of CtrA degradation|nr:conserved hypothetical protein [Candidatus Terasakiella magnetica]